MTHGASSPRVLVIACNFPPDASVGTMRTLRLVRHLSGHGWRADVLTVAPEGLRSGAVLDRALLDKVPATVGVLHRLPVRPFERLSSLVRRRKTAAPGTAVAGAAQPVPPSTAAPTAARPPRTSALGRIRRAVTAVLALPDREIGWLVPAVIAGLGSVRRNRPAVLYSSGPPFTAHLVAMVLARLTGLPWVADFRDPWARAPWREDRFAFERRAWAAFERRVVTRASAVVFATTTNRNDFSREYGASTAAKFVVVPNGCDATEFDAVVPTRGAHDRFVLLHAGSLYGARNPAGLIRALAAAVASGAVDRARFRLRFLGRIGIPGVDLRAVAQESGVGDMVEFVSHVPRRESLQQMVDASALLIVQPVTTVSIPAKLYEYLAAGRPVLALAEPGGETAALVSNSGGGLAILAEDEAAIAAALGAIVRLADRGFTPVDRLFYDGDARAAELRAVLERVAAAGAAGRR